MGEGPGEGLSHRAIETGDRSAVRFRVDWAGPRTAGEWPNGKAPDSDSPDLWAPDSPTPIRWAPDSGGHLTLGRAVDLFLAAKAAEGAAAKTLEWHSMILRRAVRGLSDDRPIEQLAAPEVRAWILELRSTLSPTSVAATSGHSRCLGTGWRPRN